MKRILLICLFLLICHCLFGKWSIGPDIGFNRLFIHSQQSDINAELNGFSVGINTNIYFGDSLYTAIGVDLMNKSRLTYYYFTVSNQVVLNFSAGLGVVVAEEYFKNILIPSLLVQLGFALTTEEIIGKGNYDSYLYYNAGIKLQRPILDGTVFINVLLEPHYNEMSLLVQTGYSFIFQ
ncbi:MAG: hypothetical protein ACLFP1_04165 [Candidatus Goldiibacteriota bacterium]